MNLILKYLIKKNKKYIFVRPTAEPLWGRRKGPFLTTSKFSRAQSLYASKVLRPEAGQSTARELIMHCRAR